MKDKIWKQKTKLDKIEIKEIIVQVLLAMICILVAIIDKNGAYFIVAGLEIVIAVQIYCDNKLLKAKDAIIELKEEENNKKNEIIKILLTRKVGKNDRS